MSKKGWSVFIEFMYTLMTLGLVKDFTEVMNVFDFEKKYGRVR